MKIKDKITLVHFDPEMIVSFKSTVLKKQESMPTVYQVTLGLLNGEKIMFQTVRRMYEAIYNGENGFDIEFEVEHIY